MKENKLRSKTYYLIDTITLWVVAILIILAWTHGQFIAKETTIIETCEGTPTSINNQPILNQTYANLLKQQIRDIHNGNQS